MSNGLYQNGLLGQFRAETRRKCFISYYAGDKTAVETFVKDFGDVFIPKTIGVSGGDDFIESDDSDYVMRRIREKYLGDSTVTICLIGSCTHSRRYIDWELKTSLRQGAHTPNGLIGILLPGLESGHLPPRFKDNYASNEDCYALYRAYPSSKALLRSWIEDAFDYRVSRPNLIKNSQTMKKYNHKCLTHNETH